MPSRFCILLLITILAVPDAPRARAQDAPLRFDVQHRRLELEWYAPTIVRITVSPDSTIIPAPSLSVTAEPVHVESSATGKGDTLVVSTRGMTVRINRLSGELRFYGSEGGLFLAAQGPGAETFVPATGEGGYRIA
jgi:hypothetical protein